ncbi:MAG: hybrid sensor histidine kinase/response regulator [Chloroflexi bacterium]|uniref:Hybrid sensor histidine kinase/response regulator n=1 Tax=Candidatus Chlorohelix allophototropha TaxID=3003348 RepID=A0A8T7LRJ1_9CHLR|nr:hybrid sensor histidine kinase/response regulator [Chloroflexota bacterium]WJW66497.1 hybrid sensor histidine kinase/response regulator [Chloroflexota bacterium L227-S17]
MRLKVGLLDLGEMLRDVSKQATVINPLCRIKVKGLNGAVIRGDRVHLESALLRLIEISASYSPGKCELALNLSLVDEGLVVDICNTTFKLSNEQQRNLHDSFHFYRPTNKHIGNFASIRDAIEEHGGKIWISGTDKNFSIFFSLPFREMETPLAEFGEDPTPYKLPPSIALDFELKRSSILLIGDNRDVLSLLKVSLNEAGWRVNIARNGVEAVESIAKQRPDLILLEWKSTSRDAHKILDRLRTYLNIRPGQLIKPPVVLMSSDNLSPMDWSKIKDMGIAGFLNKPLDFEEVKRVLANIWNNN